MTAKHAILVLAIGMFGCGRLLGGGEDEATDDEPVIETAKTVPKTTTPKKSEGTDTPPTTPSSTTPSTPPANDAGVDAAPANEAGTNTKDEDGDDGHSGPGGGGMGPGGGGMGPGGGGSSGGGR